MSPLPLLPFRVFTLDENNEPRSHVGGAGTEIAAATLAAALAQTIRVPVAVMGKDDEILAYLATPQASAP